MGNQHIGRLQAIGIGKETTSGTQATPTLWIPKKSGSIEPKIDNVKDDSACGVIDEIAGSAAVKITSESEITGILDDNIAGLFLLGTLGQETLCQAVTLTGITGGTVARGDTVSVTTPAFTGKVKKIIQVGATKYYFLSTTTGTLSGTGTVTNGTWSATFTVLAGIGGHLFERLNTNNHPAFTLYQVDPVGNNYAEYSMIDEFDLEFKTGEFATVSAKFKGKSPKTATAQTPAYTTANSFLAKFANICFADTEALLNAATVSVVDRYKLTIKKNVTDVQSVGSVDVTSLHNQQFGIAGDLEAIYTDSIFGDFVKNSTKKACRMQAINSAVTALYTNATPADNVYPSIYVDSAQMAFESWSKKSDNNNLVTQTLGFTGEFKKADAMTIEVLLINNKLTAY